VSLPPLEVRVDDDGLRYGSVSVAIDRGLRAAFLTVHGPTGPEPSDAAELLAAGASAWALSTVRELDDAILRLRFNEPEVGTWVLCTEGDPALVAAAEDVLAPRTSEHWLAREVRLYWCRTLKRLDVSARTLVALVEPGSCFVGLLAELVLAADRSFMFDGTWPDSDLAAPELRLTPANDGWFPMANGLGRLATRFWADDDGLLAARSQIGKDLVAAEAADAGLVTFTPDEIDWDDEVRLALEERASFSPDALTGLEANLRFAGPETMETKIFGRLSAWQNWIFQRPNAAGDEGALRRFGTGSRPSYDRART
jgi:benzoyl-CoA-dihydrodiol lyase